MENFIFQKMLQGTCVMKNYICKYGLYHNRPCKNNEPRSNNGFIYTAYAHALGFPIADIRDVFLSCVKSLVPIHINRLPGKIEPPISRDELIGMVHLGLLDPGFLIENKWRFYKSDLSYSFIDQIKALWSLRNKGQRAVWEEKIYAAYPITFKLMWHDRYYMKKYFKKKTFIHERIAFYAHAFVSIAKRNNKTNNISGKNLIWLQLKDLNCHFMLLLINRKKNFLDYFGEDHPFT